MQMYDAILAGIGVSILAAITVSPVAALGGAILMGVAMFASPPVDPAT